jgi:hypothetical protein
VALASAVWICANSWIENRAIRQDLLARLKIRIWQFRCRRFDFAAEAMAFQRYVVAGSSEFPISDILDPTKGPSGRISGAPLLLRLHDFLAARFGMNDAAAWDHPLGLAKMRWAAYWEGEGGLEIANAQEEKFNQAVAEAERKGAEYLP